GDAVALLGHRSDARALVAAADVFAFSSLSEGLPGAVVEALVLGTPVAAFAIPPVAELTEGDRHAWLAEPGDPDALAAAMLADRRQRDCAGRAWSRGVYVLDAVAPERVDLLASRGVGDRAGEGVRPRLPPAWRPWTPGRRRSYRRGAPASSPSTPSLRGGWPT